MLSLSIVLQFLMYLRLTFNLVVGHPLIHLAYAYEVGSKDVATESLSLACTEYDPIHEYFDSPIPDNSIFKSASFLEIISRIYGDGRFDGLFTDPGFSNIFILLEHHRDIISVYWNAWDLTNLLEAFKDSQKASCRILVETHVKGLKHDFFLAHVLTVSHAVRVVLPMVPSEHQINLLRQWSMFTLLVYIAQLRRPIQEGFVDTVELNGRDWKWVNEQAIRGKWSLDSHYVKVIRAIRNISETWGDDDSWCLKAAVKFADSFGGWGGFGKGPTPDK